MISTKSKEEILSAAHIEEVVGEVCKFKKRGSNYVGLCRFIRRKRLLSMFRRLKESINVLDAEKQEIRLAS